MFLVTSRRSPAVLWTPRRIERKIEQLHARNVLTSRIHDLEQDGVSLAAMMRHKRGLARVLASTLFDGQYEFAPASVRRVRIQDKTRTFYSLQLTDRLVHGLITDALHEAMAPLLSRSLYSYRPGRSWCSAIADFAAYIRTHRRERPDPRQRGLHVIRRDVKAYTDSIPVGDRSRLWDMLRAALAASTLCGERDWRLVVETVRPEIRGNDGRLFMLSTGVPTGLPIACALFNLYLTPLDHALAAVPDGFYARYSDDILFAHADADVVRSAATIIDRQLSDLGLSASANKGRDLYLTAAGCRSSQWPDARPAMTVPVLGCRIAADGTISLGRKKVRRFLREVKYRVACTSTVCATGDVRASGRRVCDVVNHVLRTRAQPFPLWTTELLSRVVTDRRQLHQLDYWIARIVLQAVTGSSGARGFRSLSYRRIRREWGLPSLVHMRNRWGRRT